MIHNCAPGCLPGATCVAAKSCGSGASMARGAFTDRGLGAHGSWRAATLASECGQALGAGHERGASSGPPGADRGRGGIPAGAGRVRDHVGPLTRGADHARTAADRRCAVHGVDHGGRSGRDRALAPQQRPASGTRQRARGCRRVGWQRDGTRSPSCPVSATPCRPTPAPRCRCRRGRRRTRRPGRRPAHSQARTVQGHRPMASGPPPGPHHQRTDRQLLRSGRPADGRLPDGAGLDPPAPHNPATAGSGRAHQAASTTKRRPQTVRHQTASLAPTSNGSPTRRGRALRRSPGRTRAGQAVLGGPGAAASAAGPT